MVTKVSEKQTACIFRVKQNRRSHTLMMDAAASSGTITIRKSTRCHNPQYQKVNLGLRENFESNVKFGCKQRGTQANERSRNLWLLKWIWGKWVLETELVQDHTCWQ
jgi:hypothetical protein